MLEIDQIKIENVTEGCVTDRVSPGLSFSLVSDKSDTKLEKAIIQINDFEKCVAEQNNILCEKVVNKPFTTYEVKIIATDNHGECTKSIAIFSSGRLGTSWDAKWITNKSHTFDRGTSPVPMTFCKSLKCAKKVRKAYITATAIGIYEISINGKKVGNEFFAPGFTSYKHILQYQFYDVTDILTQENTLLAVVGGGWAVGRFTYKSASKITADRQAFLMELFLEYEDGSHEKVVTDETWQVTEHGNYRFVDFYDGEIYDATVDLNRSEWKPVDIEQPPIHPQIVAQYGCAVTEQEIMHPVEQFQGKNGENIYDFGQNFAGVLKLKIRGKNGKNVTIRHAETLFQGDICVNSLRTAKQTLNYTFRDGVQEYMPRLTYMGFRYIGVSGIALEDIEVSAVALYSDMEEIGYFRCSNELLNQLQQNILWSGKSNFVDIPTDCPQRDERLGWTGDISIFSPTACFIFDMSRFLDKWLMDVRVEQMPTGGIPLVVPTQPGVGPAVATACWGDSCILVPWAEYMARGNLELLKKQYPTMKKFLSAAKRWASFFSIGKDQRRIWKLPFQFGDWCAPGNGTDVRGWLKKGPWVGTAYFANSCNIVAKVAELLGEDRDCAYYTKLRNEIC